MSAITQALKAKGKVNVQTLIPYTLYLIPYTLRLYHLPYTLYQKLPKNPFFDKIN